MKNFFENLKDILYDALDYIIMLVIVIAVIGVIGWRLDILFTGDSKSNTTISSANVPTTSKKDKIVIEDKKENLTGKIIDISIPNNSLPSKIGTILEESNLINDKDEFLEKVQSMNLDTDLSSGDYQINSNSSLEEIINIIAKQNKN